MTTIRIGSRILVPHITAQVGVARRDITPPVGIRARNWGAADWDVSEGIHRPMTLTTLAVTSGKESTQLLIAIDGGGWRRVDDEWKVRGRVLDALGLAPEQLLIALSHTHSGPTFCSADAELPGGELIPAYLESLAEAAIDAAREALANRRPGLIEWVVGRCSLASNRELDLEGRALVGFNPDGIADDTVMVGRVSSQDGEVVGTVVNYACHPTTLAWDNRLISPDYVGAMRVLVEAETGAPCLFLQGASGELAPREQYSGDVEVADRHGRALGHAVLAALDGMPLPGTELELMGAVESGAPLAIWRGSPFAKELSARAVAGFVELHVVDLPSIEELTQRWAGIDEHVREERLARARNQRDGRTVSSSTVQFPVWAWRWGDAIIVGQPGEAYSRFQHTLRDRFPDHPIVVINLANGPGFGYLPTQDAYDRGAYQAWQTMLVAGSLDRLEDYATSLIRTLLDEAPSLLASSVENPNTAKGRVPQS